MTLTFDPVTLELVRNVSRGTYNFRPILVFLPLFVVEFWANMHPDWPRDLITFNFHLWRHRPCR